MPRANTEDQLVEQPAIQLFATLGWETVSASDEAMGSTGTLGRETTADVVLMSRLRAALERLNPTATPAAIALAIESLTRNRATMSLVAANREVYGLLKTGVPVSVPDREHGGQKTERLRVIDCQQPLVGNDFLLVSQMTVTGALYTVRPDLIGFVNGLPLVVVELKKPGVPAKQAFDDNLTSYKHPQNGIPDLFWYNALLMASNGIESRVGTLTADWERFFEWKRVEREDEPRRVSLEVMLRGVCDPDLNDAIYEAIESADLDEEQEKRLERELGRQYHLITRDDRLETVAKDVVQHFLGRGFQGKAMVVSIDKATALRMHDKVRKHWQAERERVESELSRLSTDHSELDTDRVRELERRLHTLATIDMAVVVSPGQNEVEQMKAFGIDIVPHRQRMNSEPLDEKFKDPDDPLRLVFLCAMWLTGFDVPSCSTIYLDKPMRNHTLMQTIARANRVFPGKHSGLIVDYANVFASLEKALAIYAKGSGEGQPVRDKQQLVAELEAAINAATEFCAEHGVVLADIEAQPAIAKAAARDGSQGTEWAGGLDRLTRIADAVDRLISPDPLRKEFLGHARWVTTLYQAVKPDPAIISFSTRVSTLALIANTIRERLGEGPADISGVMKAINALLDESIGADGFVVRERSDASSASGAAIDLAAIDFEALAKRFATATRKSVELEQLKAAVKGQLNKLIRVNKTRADYLAKFEALIESYNAGSRNIDELFKELLALSRDLSDEEQRHVREHLTEDELTVFDLLTRPGPDLTTEEHEEVKKVAHHLLERVRATLVLDWRHRAQARAQVRLAIEDTLDEGLPRAFTPEIYQAKCDVLFEHVFETFGDSASA